MLLSNLKRLLLPYLFWVVVSQLFDILSGTLDVQQAVQNVFFFNGTVGWNAALWFLLALFWTDTVCSIIIRISKSLQIIISIVFLALFVLFDLYKIVIPLGLYTVPIACLFWLLGYWLNSVNFICRIKEWPIVSATVLGVAMLLVNIICGVVFNTVISIYHAQYDNYALTVVSGVAGIVSLMTFATFIKQSKVSAILVFYGKNTLPILCTHYLILRLISWLSNHFFGFDCWRSVSSLKAIILTAIIFLLYYPAILAIHKARKVWIIKHII